MTPTASGGAPPPDVDMGTLAATIYTFVWKRRWLPSGFGSDGL